MKDNVKKIAFILFFASGFCGLLYQVVWLRLAFRHFGVITPVMSVVLSVFMLGLAIGSWTGGRWIKRLSAGSGISPLNFYAATELLIGCGSVIVPKLFTVSENYLLSLGSMDSAQYLIISALLIMADILPWCIFMGFTFPFMMEYMKRTDPSGKTGFSFLYLANVIGALFGTLVTAFILIEIAGFRNTLYLAGACNLAIAATSFILGRHYPVEANSPAEPVITARTVETKNKLTIFFPAILFLTGFISMALEVVWTRAFTPVLETTVYAFAALLASYLLATFIGSHLYRRDITRSNVLSNESLFAIIAISAFLPIVLDDPRINYNGIAVLASIMPVSAALGYLTPKLIDEYSLGDAKTAGFAYAANIAGCIIGPLFTSYLILPNAGARAAMILLALPLLLLCLFTAIKQQGRIWRIFAPAVAVILMLISSLFSVSYDERGRTIDYVKYAVVRHDYAATVTSLGEGMNKLLLVNGYGMTTLRPVTKMLAHWPMLLHNGTADNTLAICFGMGTTYRSLLSWPTNVTSVELVPGVRDAFGYYHSDAAKILEDPRGKIIIDDGRRFLARSQTKYDVITIDPPPPITSAGSGFLYSREFFEILKSRLNEDGILQIWVWPGASDKYTRIAINQSITDAFTHVKVFEAFDIKGGYLYIASKSAIEIPTVEKMLAKMPQNAQNDMTEWSTMLTPKQTIQLMLDSGSDAPRTTLNDSNNIMLTDDRPANEYFFVRRLLN